MKTIVIMQGAPGSGKSTVAQALHGQEDNTLISDALSYICSADRYFEQNGKYVFNPKEIKRAHEWCQDSANIAMALKIPQVIVDNTNIHCWEAREYVKMAQEYGYDIQFIRCTGGWENVHGVPSDKVQLMRARMENLSVEACLAARAPWEK